MIFSTLSMTCLVSMALFQKKSLLRQSSPLPHRRQAPQAEWRVYRPSGQTGHPLVVQLGN